MIQSTITSHKQGSAAFEYVAAGNRTARRAIPAFGMQPGIVAKQGIENPILQKLLYHSQDSLSKIFQHVTEVFIFGIMAIDVFALWLPRIINALRRGAYAYDPASDPKNQGASRSEIFLRTVKNRWQGLNWINGFEETMREVASGPASFVWPTIMLGIARKLYGKTGVELDRDTLHHMTDSFKHFLEKHPELVQPGKQQDALSAFIKKSFSDTGLARYRNPETGTTYQKTLNSLVNQWAGLLEKQRGGTALAGSEKKALRQSLKEVEYKISKLIVDFNRRHHSHNRFYQYQTLPVRWHVPSAANGKALIQNVSSPELMENFKRFDDIIRTAQSIWKKEARQTFPKILDRVRKNMIIKKALASILSTTATLLFLFKLVKWSQYHDRYEANRLYTVNHPTPNTKNVQNTSAALRPSQQTALSYPAGNTWQAQQTQGGHAW